MLMRGECDAYERGNMMLMKLYSCKNTEGKYGGMFRTGD